MRIVFLGSSDFAVPCLNALMGEGHDILCVVTQPDRRKGRGLQLAATKIKELALQRSLELFQPLDINSAESVSKLRSFGCQVMVIVAYGQILSRDVLSVPSIMPVNVHASLLPAYRGAAPINWAIINGETKTGNTLMKVTRKMDSGPVILRKEVGILAQDTALSLEKKLSQEAGSLLVQGLQLIDSGKAQLYPQDESAASFAPKLTHQTGLIDWSWPAVRISNLVRGLFDHPGAYTYYKGKRVKILQAVPLANPSIAQAPLAGQVIGLTAEGIEVCCGKQSLMAIRLQPESGRAMQASEFIAGHRVLSGDLFGNPEKK